jgi:hypothetical protein
MLAGTEVGWSVRLPELIATPADDLTVCTDRKPVLVARGDE